MQSLEMLKLRQYLEELCIILYISGHVSFFKSCHNFLDVHQMIFTVVKLFREKTKSLPALMKLGSRLLRITYRSSLCDFMGILYQEEPYLVNNSAFQSSLNFKFHRLKWRKALHLVADLHAVINQFLALQTKDEQVHHLTNAICRVPYRFYNFIKLQRHLENSKYDILICKSQET